MKRLAIVVQRCHPDIVGGAEQLALHYARLLSEFYQVDVLTSRAKDATDWSDYYPEVEKIDSIQFRRFSARPGHTRYWSQLYETIVHYSRSAISLNDQSPEQRAQLGWTRAQQEEWLRAQGPDCPELIAYLRRSREDYQAFLFVTYLFATTYFGLGAVNQPGRSFLVPALHDEPAATLPIFRGLPGRVRQIFWNTPAEADLGQRLWQTEEAGRVLSIGLVSGQPEAEDFPDRVSPPYILYCGRIDPGKGCSELIDYVRAYNRSETLRIRLKMIGNVGMKIRRDRDLDVLGFVSEEKKIRLIREAAALVVPSPNESLSIVSLEAMREGVPVIALDSNPVLANHIADGRGIGYHDAPGFLRSIRSLLAQTGEEKHAMLTRARRYVYENFHRDRVAAILRAEVEGVSR